MTLNAFRYSGEPATNTGAPSAEGAYFRGQATHLLCRIRDHIERLDSGVVYAVDDLAVALRALLLHTRGNRVLLRLARAAQRNDIEIRLSRAPAHHAVFSVGAIPTSEPTAEQHGAEWVALDRWASRPVLRMTERSRLKTFTWGDFLNAYANKWGGAHLDLDVPQTLQNIDLYECGGLSLSGYLLRTAAVQTWLIGQALLAEPPFTTHSGKPLSVQEKLALRQTAPGGIADDPRDRRADGELQFLDYRAAGLELVGFVVPNRSTRMRIQIGPMGWDLECSIGEHGMGDSSPAPRPVRAREIAPTSIDPSDFSEGRMMPVRARFLPFTVDSGAEATRHP